jgi:hypothetical protein
MPSEPGRRRLIREEVYDHSGDLTTIRSHEVEVHPCIKLFVDNRIELWVEEALIPLLEVVKSAAEDRVTYVIPVTELEDMVGEYHLKHSNFNSMEGNCRLSRPLYNS